MIPIYHPTFVESPDLMFDHLMNLNWLEVTEARKEYFMSFIPRSYIYGKGKGEREYHSSEYSIPVQILQGNLNDKFGTEYNVCFLNRYDNQFNQLGWHADDSPSMDTTHPIAVISFGAVREIWWKDKEFTGVIPKQNRQLLGHGSLFVMPAGFQEKNYHRIPKCDRSCGIRISLTFRKYI